MEYAREKRSVYKGDNAEVPGRWRLEVCPENWVLPFL